jgi:hypothetical protein
MIGLTDTEDRYVFLYLHMRIENRVVTYAYLNIFSLYDNIMLQCQNNEKGGGSQKKRKKSKIII